MPLGKLNRLVKIMAPGTGQDEIGQPSVTMVQFAQVWANVLHISGIEAIRANADSSTVRASIRVRRRTDIAPPMEVNYQGTNYKINAVLPDEEDRQYMFLVCEVIR